MKSYRFGGIIICLFLCNTLCAMASTARVRRSVPLLVYLDSVSSQLGCYYTIESLPSASGSTVFKGAQISDSPQTQTITALVVKLNKDLPKVFVLRDQKSPNVIHLIDKVLYNDPNYALNKIVSINYKGRLIDLPDFIGAYLNQTLTSRHAIFGPLMHFDNVTQVQVRANSETVRSVLTNCLSIKSYEHYLWTAHAWQEDDKRNIAFDYGWLSVDFNRSRTPPKE